MSEPFGPGRLQIYTGEGKGKTTAALGLAIRSCGAGYRVFLVQFDKGHREGHEHYCERPVLRTIPNLEFHPTGLERMMPDGSFRFGVTGADRAEAARGIEIAERALTEPGVDVVILDDVVGGLSYGLLDRPAVDRLLDIWAARRDRELVMTGRDVPAEYLERADLVTEMRKVKHYYDAGEGARRGIEW